VEKSQNCYWVHCKLAMLRFQMTFFIRLLLAFDKVIGRRSAAVSNSEAKRAPERHPGLSRIAILCLCLVQTEGLFGQNSPATLPNARVSKGGLVNAISVQGDEKVIIAGQFESVNGIPRDNIARLNVNGSLDETWNPGTIDWSINVLAIAGTNLFVGGNGLAKFSTTESGARDTVWNPHFADGAQIDTLAVSDSYLYVGGVWLFGVEAQRNLIRFSITGSGTVDNSWRPTTDWFVSALALDGTNLYVGGTFTRIGGKSRRGLAKVSTVTGVVDPVWNPNVEGQVSPLFLRRNDLYLGF